MARTSRHQLRAPVRALAATLAALATLTPVASSHAEQRIEQPTVGGAIEVLEDALANLSGRLGPVGDAVKPKPTGPFFPVRGVHHFGEAAAVFGASRSGRSHSGQDIFAAPGTPLVAVRDSRVIESGSDGGRGNYVVIYSAKADQTYVYLHMIEPPRHGEGDRVRAGERLGGVGCTGSCWGDHVHFEIRTGPDGYGTAINPMPVISRWDKRGPDPTPYG